MSNHSLSNHSFARIHWHEGMSLAPQHFQQQERHWEAYWRAWFQAQPYAWGFQQYEIDRQLLTFGKINLQFARGFFRDGTPFLFHAQVGLPASRSIEKTQAPCLVYLAIPQNTQKYKTIEISLADENDFEDQNIITVSAETLNACFLTEPEKLDAFHVLPLLRIAEIRSNDEIILDENFIPPCIHISANSTLMQIHKGICDSLEERIKALSDRLMHNQETEGLLENDFLLLSALNRVFPLFLQWRKNTLLHPQKTFMDCYLLLSELCTFTKNERRLNAIYHYQHQNVGSSFLHITKDLLEALHISLEQQAKKLSLQKENNHIWRAEIADSKILFEANLVLSVYVDVSAEVSPATLATHIKVAPYSVLGNLISRSLSGVPLQPMRIAPRQIAAQGCHYFALEKQNEHWQHLQQERSIGIYVGGTFQNIKIELWSIRG